jgi:hypothetical protein
VKKIFEKQGWHVLGLMVLLAAVFFLSQLPGILTGSALGVNTSTWLWLSILVPIGHQVIVALGWRAQLHNQWLTRLFGKRDFLVFGIVFMLFFLSRPITIILLAISNIDTLNLSLPIRIIVSIILFIPLPYLMYSILKYFGFKRAMGIDHFDPAYRELPMVTEGIFKFTNNAMYTLGFLMFWIPGFIWASKAALLSAAFSHLYIWVHFYTVEKPDMEVIYVGNI